MRVLLVKLTSMGDLIHALPAITDAARAIPGISFDWVIEKNFSEVAQWHPAVKNIITTSHRRWKKNIIESYKKGEFQQFLRSLRKEKYDLVIDGQSSVKSAVITLLAKGLRCGMDKNSVREWLAHFAYQKSVFVDKDIHALTRLRLLFSQILNYSITGEPDYGIADHYFSPLPETIQLPKPYVYFVHNASWQSKMWPEAYWQELCNIATADGLNVLLPWGNVAEQQRAIRIKANNSKVQVLPFCNLSQHAVILKNSQGAICSDTGLGHIAAALGVPALTLYGSTSIKLIGTTGVNQQQMMSPFPCTLCYKEICKYDHKIHDDAQCQVAIKPSMVWQQFKTFAVKQTLDRANIF